MNSAYNFNLYIYKEQLFINVTFPGCLEWPVYKGLSIFIHIHIVSCRFVIQNQFNSMCSDKMENRITKFSKLISMYKEQNKNLNAKGKHRCLFFKSSFYVFNDTGLIDDQMRE